MLVKAKNLYLLSCIALFQSFSAGATTLAPDPTGTSTETAWNNVVGSGSFSTLQLLIKGSCCALYFIFTAWVFYGLYNAVTGPKPTLTGKAALMYAIRSVVMLTLAIWIFTK